MADQLEYNKVEETINDFTNDNLNKLAQLFPAAVKDGAVDFEALKEELGDFKEVDSEKYELTWAGKQKAKQVALKDVYGRTLKYVPEDSKNPETTENLYIEGDNLEVLKLLRRNYYGAIKMIYIDPPYNTGNDFVYNDNFSMSAVESEIAEGNRDELGEKYQVNSKSQNRYHANWLNMMYPRLKVAKDLLKEDGVIFISIDDNEVDNLIKICNEILGQENYINTISVNSKVSAGASGGGEDKKLKKNIEYLVIYCKNIDALTQFNSIFKETELMDYIDRMKKDKKSFKYTNVLHSFEEVVPFKTIKDGDGNDIDVYKVNKYVIKTVKQLAKEENISEKEIYYKYYDKIMTTTNAQTSIRDRVWSSTDNENNMYMASYIPKSGKNKGKKIDLIFMGKQKVLVIWLKDSSIKKDGVIYKREKIGTYWDGFSWINVTKEGSIKFDNGKKPIAYIERMIDLILQENIDITVMDFFSGSCSLGHAVMQKRTERINNKVNFIAIQIPEVIKPINKKNIEFIKYLKEEGLEPIVSELGKERIRRAGDKIIADNPELADQLDIGFKVFKVADTNIKWNYKIELDEQFTVDTAVHTPDLIDFMPGSKDEDIVYEVMLRQNDVPLSSSIEVLSEIGSRTYLYASSYLVCLETEITEALVDKLAALNPLPIKFIFRDSAFQDDIALKDETFRRLKALIEKNAGTSKKTYTVEFI
ncbi:MAG: adenine-specific DNA-methyltransferase [Acetobacterium sp.]|nr:adenine-specific DNA-methyltransferase [Acetobacterium sp.]